MGRAEVSQDLGLGKGWMELLAFSCALGIGKGNSLQSLWEKSATTAGFCFLPSPTMTRVLLIRAAIALGPYKQLTSLNKGHFSICPDALGKSWDLWAPSPSKGASAGCVQEPGSHCPAPLSYCQCSEFFATAATHPWPAGTPQPQSFWHISFTIPEFCSSLPFQLAVSKFPATAHFAIRRDTMTGCPGSL